HRSPSATIEGSRPDTAGRSLGGARRARGKFGLGEGALESLRRSVDVAFASRTRQTGRGGSSTRNRQCKPFLPCRPEGPRGSRYSDTTLSVKKRGTTRRVAPRSS